jgi:hypothetical protein
MADFHSPKLSLIDAFNLDPSELAALYKPVQLAGGAEVNFAKPPNHRW